MGHWILYNKPPKEFLELEEMGYFDLGEKMGGFDITVNPEKEDEVERLLLSTSSHNLGLVFPICI
jgi:hypothetical protein